MSLTHKTDCSLNRKEKERLFLFAASLPSIGCEIFSGPWAASTWTNDLQGEDLCAEHVSGGECDEEVSGWGFS